LVIHSFFYVTLFIIFLLFLFYFCGVCSNLAWVSSSSYSVNTYHSFSRFTVLKRPSRLHFLNKFMNICCAWKCVPRKFTKKLSPILSIGATCHIGFVKKTCFSTVYRTISTHSNNQYLIRCQKQLQSCLNNFSRQLAVALGDKSCSSCREPSNDN
jgi:hypothetical protein